MTDAKLVLISIHIKQTHLQVKLTRLNDYFICFTGNYGEKGFEVFRNLAVTQGVCLATNEAAPGVEDPDTYDDIVRKLLRTNSSRVIVCLCEGMTVRRLLQATWRIPEARGYFQILARYQLSLVVRKPVFGVSDQVWHKPGCAITEYG